MANRAIDVLSTIDRKEVQSIGQAINDAFVMANERAQQAIGHYLEIGKLLHDARQFFEGDKEYGQWRAENTALSQSWANKLTRVYDTYGDKPPKSLPISTLAELTNATESTRKKLEAQAEDPEQKTPSVRDVKQVVKEENQKPLTGEARVTEQIAKKSEPKTPTLSMEAQAQDAIDLPINERISIWNGIPHDSRTEIDAFILLGLPAYFDGMPNVDTIILIISVFRDTYETTEFDEAYDVIKEWMK